MTALQSTSTNFEISQTLHEMKSLKSSSLRLARPGSQCVESIEQTICLWISTDKLFNFQIHFTMVMVILIFTNVFSKILPPLLPTFWDICIEKFNIYGTKVKYKVSSESLVSYSFVLNWELSNINIAILFLTQHPKHPYQSNYLIRSCHIPERNSVKYQ